ncbi:MAG: FAD-linked oxidoreductase [Chitinophagales bacterium]|nr:MAG: FAD-linked oxidoreductase [Chitinophagales bacterium]
MQEKKHFSYRNWAGNVRFTAAKFFQPESEQDIIAIVKEAAFSGSTIRVVGAGHSWSPLVCASDYLINLDRYNRVLHVNHQNYEVKVQAGIRIKELNRILELNGMALCNLGSISEQSIAGAISTGTHGTGIQFGCLATQVIGLRLILCDGRVLELSENDPRMDACRVSLGCLGIISEVALRCCPVFQLAEQAYPLPFNEALQLLPDLIRSTDHLKLWWFPHVDQIQIYRYQRTHKKAMPPVLIVRWFNDYFLAAFVFRLFLGTGKLVPSLVPLINRVVCFLHFKKRMRTDKSYRMFNVPMPPPHRESEYAIRVEDAIPALQALRNCIDQSGWMINFIVEARFVKGDNIWLSPAYGRDSCFIGAYQYNLSSWSAYKEAFESLMKKYGGRPHWGKEFSVDQSYLQEAYPRFDSFRKLLRELDPEGMFQNAFTRKIFQEE